MLVIIVNVSILIWLLLHLIWVLCDAPPAETKIRRIEATLVAVKAELAALEALTEHDRDWLRYWGTVNQQPWPLPEIGSIWEWDVGNAMGREVVKVTGVTFAPLTVRIDSYSGVREVTLEEFSQKALPAPLGKKR